MTNHDLTPEDTAAMRATPGDWREYLRLEIARGRARRDGKPPVRAPAQPPGHRPGAWPPGTRPPDLPPPIPDTNIARALAAYRANPDQDHPCQCPACQQLTGGNR